MKKVHKYSVGEVAIQWLTVPKGAELLTIELQGGFPFLWVLVDDAQTVFVKCEIVIYKTGEKIREYWTREQYLGTLIVANDTKVYHFFGEVFNDTEIEPPADLVVIEADIAESNNV